jgi:predicted SprT family Zn-dependent metalloprotease
MTDNETMNVQSLLQHDLIKLCRQIGIRDDEIPKPEFNKFRMMNLLNSIDEYSPQSGFGHAIQKEIDSHGGLCMRGFRTIFIKCDKDGHKEYSYEDLYVILAHELVHYRFFKETKSPKPKRHTKAFYDLLDSVLRGDKYPKVKLFSVK